MYFGRDLLIGLSIIGAYMYFCSEADEIYKICSVIGSPTKDTWADGLHLARDINYQFPRVSFAFLFSCMYFLCMCCRRYLTLENFCRRALNSEKILHLSAVIYFECFSRVLGLYLFVSIKSLFTDQQKKFEG